jgi:hypothetical protein
MGAAGELSACRARLADNTAWAFRSAHFETARGGVACSGAGLTALHLAALKGAGGAVRALLQAGALLNTPTLSAVLTPHLAPGSTALHLAAARGHAACVRLLLDAAAADPGVRCCCACPTYS